MPFFDGNGPHWGGCHGAGWGRGPCGRGSRRGLGARLGWFWNRTKTNDATDLTSYRKELEEELRRVKEEEASLSE